ncbi:MAG: DUF5911 domain-containing protein, partial [Chloroflexi bacterium]|nr:DUF5911 domain-containing protein [Chloroflexota bacterium]
MSRSDEFPPIESLAFLSDCVVTALVTATGTVDWLCLPRMDGPSVFGAILDRRAGHFRIGPVGGPVATSRRYLPGSLVLETTWVTTTGTLVLTDALVVDEAGRSESCLVRIARCTSGELTVEVDEEMAPGYGAGDGRRGESGTEHLRAGQSFTRVLAWGDAADGQRPEDGAGRIAATVAYWNDWLACGDIPAGPNRSLLERSALTLKGLVHAPTGAVMAAATTSLPETRGGTRNWDYRYTWIRDGVCTMA